MSVKGLYRNGMQNSYKFDMEELVSNTALPFHFLVDDSDKERYYQDFVTEAQCMCYGCKSFKNKKIVPINEATRKELISGADVVRLARSKKLTTKYYGVSNSRGWITFKTNSQYTPGKKYTQYIKLNEADDMKYFKEFNKRDIIRLFLSGDLKVHCTCPDYRYRMKYMAYNLGYGIYRETRFPKIRNPRLEGTVCKHLLCVLAVLNMNWSKIAKDMQKSKFFKRKYEDEEYMRELEQEKQSKKKS